MKVLKTNVVIGIDPGEHVGIAVYDMKERKFIDLKTLHHPHKKGWGFLAALGFLEKLIPAEVAPDDVSIIIEHPPSFIYRRNQNFGGTAKGGNKQALNIGGNRREAELLGAFCMWRLKVPQVRLLPPVKEQKWTKREGDLYIGFKKHSQHARDAARLCLFYGGVL